MDFNVIIEKDEDGMYIAEVSELEGCYTQGKTLQEVVERIKEAIEVCLEENAEIVPNKFIGIQRVQVGKSLSA